MNKRIRDTTTTAAVRALDPAGPTGLSEAERERADATLTRILATPSPGPVAQESVRPRRRRGRLLVLVGLGGATATALLLGGGSSALASWTPEPEALTGAAATEAVTTCRTALGRSDQGEPAVIVERRGGWTYVLMNGPEETLPA